MKAGVWIAEADRKQIANSIALLPYIDSYIDVFNTEIDDNFSRESVVAQLWRNSNVHGGGGCGAESDPYHVVVSLALLPRLQSAVSTGWAPREPEPLLAFLDAWHPLLPPDLYRHVTETLVFPKVRLPPVTMYLYRLSKFTLASSSYQNLLTEPFQS